MRFGRKLATHPPRNVGVGTPPPRRSATFEADHYTRAAAKRAYSDRSSHSAKKEFLSRELRCLRFNCFGGSECTRRFVPAHLLDLKRPARTLHAHCESRRRVL